MFLKYLTLILQNKLNASPRGRRMLMMVYLDFYVEKTRFPCIYTGPEVLSLCSTAASSLSAEGL